MRYAQSVHNIEFRLTEGRRKFVFNDFRARTVARCAFRIFQNIGLTHVDPYRCVEFQRLAARGHFGIAEHNADFFAKLVDKDDAGLALVDDARKFAERLTHEPRLKPHVRVAHIALDLRLRRKRRNGVDNDNIDGGRAYQRIDDVERLFARIGLGYVKFVQIYAEVLCVNRIERMLCVDECRNPAHFLRLRDGVKRNGGFTRRFGTVDLHDSAARQSADPERQIERQASRGDHFDILTSRGLSQLHDRAFPVGFFDLRQHRVQRFEFFFVHNMLLRIFSFFRGG